MHFHTVICIAVVVYRRNKNKGTRQPKSPARSDKESTQTTEDIELDSIESLPRNVKTKDSMDHSKEVTSRNAGKSSTPSPSTQFNKMFVTIVVAYVLSFLPGGIILLVLISNRIGDAAVFFLGFPVWQMQMIGILDRTSVINYIVNPFIYAYFDTDFRKHLMNILPLFCRRKV